MSRLCLDGTEHGPTVLATRRTWWKPWRKHEYVACWVCRKPLNPTAAEAAERRWRPAFDHYVQCCGGTELAPGPNRQKG